MANYYDPQKMKTVASSIASKAQQFHDAAENVKQIVNQLSVQWDDPVNKKFSSHYLTQGAEKAQNLEKYIRSYAAIMNQCSEKFGKTIDDGNTFFNSF